MTNKTVITNTFSTQSYRPSTDAFVDIFETRDPTSLDVNYPIQKKWINTSAGKMFVYTGQTTANGVVEAIWTDVTIANADLSTLTGDDLLPVVPVNSNINIVSSASGAIQFANGGDGELEATVRTDNKTIYVNSNNQLTVNNSGTFWSVIEQNTQMQDSHGYILQIPGGTIQLLLPTQSDIGDTLEILLDGAQSFIVVPNAGQTITFLTASTTLNTGTVVSTSQGNYLRMVCTVPNLQWRIVTVTDSIVLS